jgi:hypothetical protein
VRWHRGEVLCDQFAATAAAEPELLAHHFTQAGMTEAAIEWWGTAGQRSMARYALVEGAEQLKRALDQIATLPTTPVLRREEIKLEVAFANALALTGATLWVAKSTTTGRSRFMILPNTVRLRRVLAGMLG